MSKSYDDYECREYLRKEYCCCDCGYMRNLAHHPAIRCPVTGRCGQCGNDWPCEEHKNMVPEKFKNKVDKNSYVKKV